MADPRAELLGLFPNARITSNFRTPEQQQRLIDQGLTTAKHSDHLTGNAYDFVVPGMSSAQAKARMVAAGVPNRIILAEGNHVHWSLPRGGAQMAQADGSDIFGGAAPQQQQPAAGGGLDGSDIFADAPPQGGMAPQQQAPHQLDPAVGLPENNGPAAPDEVQLDRGMILTHAGQQYQAQTGQPPPFDPQNPGSFYHLTGTPDPTAPDMAAPGGHRVSPMSMQALIDGAPKKDQGLGFAKGLFKPLDNASTAVEDGLGHLGVDTNAIASFLHTPTAHQAQQGRTDYLAREAANGVLPGKIGEFGGNVVGTAANLAATKNPWIGGALAGLELTDHKDLPGIATDAVVGAVSGKVGDAAISGAGKVIAPKVSAAVRTLLDQGVRLTPGQITGGAYRGIEDKLTSIPLIGDMIRGGQRQAMDDFNRAAVNRALKPVGASLPKSVSTGHDAVGYAQTALSDAYTKVLPKVSLKFRSGLASDLTALSPDIASLVPQRQAQLQQIIKDRVLGKFTRGTMTGETMKSVDSDLGRLAREYSSGADPDARAMAGVLRDVQTALREAVARQNPTQAPIIRAINAGYANLVRVESAAGKSTGGVFNANQLRTAVRQGDSSARKRASASGGAMMQDLADAGSKVLPSTVPDSGTTGRMLLNAGALGGAGVLGKAAPVTIPAMGILGLAYSKGGQAAMRGILGRVPTKAEVEAAKLLAKGKTPAQLMGAASVVGARQPGPDQ